MYVVRIVGLVVYTNGVVEIVGLGVVNTNCVVGGGGGGLVV